MKNKFLKISFSAAIALVLCVLAFGLYYFINYKKFEVISIEQKNIEIISKIEGKISFLLSNDDLKVKKGQIIAKIGNENYKKNYDSFNKKLEELRN